MKRVGYARMIAYPFIFFPNWHDILSSIEQPKKPYREVHSTLSIKMLTPVVFFFVLLNIYEIIIKGLLILWHHPLYKTMHFCDK